MAPPQRKLPAGYELAIGGYRGHKVTKHKAEKPFKVRPSRQSSVSASSFLFKLNSKLIVSLSFSAKQTC